MYRECHVGLTEGMSLVDYGLRWQLANGLESVGADVSPLAQLAPRLGCAPETLVVGARQSTTEWSLLFWSRSP